MKKITTFKILTLAAALCCGVNAAAQDFNLSSLSLADIKASQASIKVPAAPQQTASDDMIGVDLNIRVPYKTLKKGLELVAASEKRITIIDNNAPIAYKSGEFLKISNIRVDQGGIIVIPTLTIKPYLVATDKLAIRVQRIQLHASMEPSMKAASLPAVNQEEVMAQVMDVMVKGIYSALNNYFKKKELPITAEKVIAIRYDKAAWTLYADVSSKEIHNLINSNLMGELHVTGFSFSDAGLSLKLQTAE